MDSNSTTTRAGTIERIALASGVVAASWLMMQVVHEAGHVGMAMLRGTRVEAVHLHPLSFSHTALTGPTDLPIVLAGAGVGVLLPLILWVIFHALKLPGRALMRFFAGFCLIANGVYLGIGWIDHVGDAGDLLVLGMSPLSLCLLGLLGTAGGLACWHGLGPWLGLRDVPKQDARLGGIITLSLTLLTVAIELLLGGEVRFTG